TPVGVDDRGIPVLLKQVTTSIHFGPDMRRGAGELNGEGEAVGGIVVMRYGENALKVINRVKAKIDELRPSLPEGMEIIPVYDRSSLIERAMDNLREKLIEEMVVVSIVIIVFLLHLRSAFVVIIALPVGVLLSFIPMYFLGVTTNIMSLGGIAIAIGAMVDGSIVIIENVHKKLEHWEAEKAERQKLGDAGETAKLNALPPLPEREAVLIDAAKSVGRPIFFALLVIAVSFLPVFVLEAQSGRLFRPLAFTKTFAMLFGAILAVTLTPALLSVFVRGHIIPEGKNPVNRFLIWLYNPVVHFVLRFKWIFLGAALLVLALTYIPFANIGSEFMPPLNEGSLLYMPGSVPGISIETGKKALQQQDALIKSVPEVKTVFGKVGRSRSLSELVKEEREEPCAKKRDHVPDHETGDKRDDRHGVFDGTYIHMQRVTHKPGSYSGNERDSSEANDPNHSDPYSGHFKKMLDVNHNSIFGFTDDHSNHRWM
ncbi:MAG: efflux RND transporter permease subunit, partial [Verrucomicrobiota bacterium]|nr:efflux RND transporter permease subunit [Verrucomicrobiota bacterium]